jgi:hypothetical protein
MPNVKVEAAKDYNIPANKFYKFGYEFAPYDDKYKFFVLEILVS